jgi:hypothetical protein
MTPSVGDEWNVPDFQYLFALLRNVVCSAPTATAAAWKSLPPTWRGVPGAVPTPDADAPALSQADRDLLLNKTVMQHLLLIGTTRKRGEYASDIVAHLCWENRDFSELVVGYFSVGLEEYDADVVRPYFRPMMAMVLLEDSLQAERVHSVLESLTAIMKLQQKFWKITHLCAEHLIRMAKRCRVVAQWVHKQRDKIKWLVEWMAQLGQYSYGRIQTWKPTNDPVSVRAGGGGGGGGGSSSSSSAR